MEKVTDWNALWKELVEIRDVDRRKRRETGEGKDPWTDRAHRFHEGVRERWRQNDSSREFILSRVDADSTVLDVGTGTGAWSMMLARHVRRVTAVDPSESMLSVLHENMAAENVSNVSVVQGTWPDVDVEPHDFSLCSHAMYGCPDFAAFIRGMEKHTRRTCFLLLRATAGDCVQAEAARRLWGQPFDSPNFAIAYNVLIQMGIYANVLMENTGYWKPRVSPNIDAALQRLKREMYLAGVDEHDRFLIDLLRRRLSWKDGVYVWPKEVCSALVYWNPEK
ncbi:MAG: class I SAM-dependent methyltransferase [Acidobacteria bacterium]|nr:class I SAM-dependent methyltransferase [Acidobacteriota bacterium]